MATEVYDGPLGTIRAASTASGGTALTSTAAFIVLPAGTVWFSATPRNLSTAVVVKLALNPYLTVFKTTDSLATNPTDASAAMQDNSTGTALSLNSLDTAANGDFIYVGSPLTFRGVRVTIGDTNTVGASVLTVKYWDGSAWSNITAVDGTTGGGDTFNTTGNVTWTVPTDWKKASLADIGDTTVSVHTRSDLLTTPLFWTRWQTSAAFDTTVTATEMYAMNNSTAYGELLSGQTFVERVNRTASGYAVLEVLTDAGTANLIVNVAAGPGGFA